MSETDGLSKLAEYLNQTRRQAEQSIDILNTKISELVNESEAISSERDYFRNYSEQLKLENSQKWRLQERDDWKSLVESVQTDRGRLQENCIRLEIELEEAKAGVKILEEEINLIMNNESDPLSAEDYDTKLQRGGSIDNSQEGLDFNPRSRSSSQSQILTGETSSPFRTPLRISTSTADRAQWRTPSPRAVSLKLQVDLQRALAKDDMKETVLVCGQRQMRYLDVCTGKIVTIKTRPILSLHGKRPNCILSVSDFQNKVQLCILDRLLNKIQSETSDLEIVSDVTFHISEPETTRYG